MLPWGLLPQPSNLHATRAGDEPGTPGRPSAPSGGGSAPPGRAPAALDEPERVVVLPVHLVSQRRQRLLVEPPAGARIAAAEADVLDHAFGVRRAGRHRKSD